MTARTPVPPWMLCIPFVTLILLSYTASAQLAHLDDAAYEPFRSLMPPLDRHAFPRVGLTETKTLPPTAEAISKWDTVLVNVSQISNALRTAQSINPDLLVFRKYNAGGYQGYNLRDACNDPLGIPFGSAGPATANCQFFSGHWAYYAGTVTTESIQATSTSVAVSDPTRLTAGRYVVIYDAPAGSFRNAEHALVQSVSGNRVTFARRGYKSSQYQHPAGSIIAEHPIAAGGRTGENALHWRFNVSSACPRDSNGKQLNELMPVWLRTNFSRNGQGNSVNIRLAGIILDTDIWNLAWENRIDIDNDLVPDGGWNRVTGTNYWGVGTERFYDLLRAQFPTELLVGGDRHVRGFGSLNGTQMEGWPVSGVYHSPTPVYLRTDEVLANSVLHLREGPSNVPAFVENFSKTPTRQYSYGVSPRPTSNAPFRFAFGLSLLDNGYYSQESMQDVPDPWWDEFSVDVSAGSPTYGYAVAPNPGDESRTRVHKGWLGLPLGERERVYDAGQMAAERSLVGNGGLNSSSQLTGWQASNVRLAFDPAVRIAGTGSLRISQHINYSVNASGASVRSPLVPLRAGAEYTLAFSARGDQTRNVTVTAGGQTQTFTIPGSWVRRVMTFTAGSTGNSAVLFQVGQENVGLWLDEVYLLEGNADIFTREFENGLVVVNATSRERSIPLPEPFLRIRGTGQDSVNDGSTVTSVTLAANDAAILVRRQGSSNPPPDSEASCGQPSYSTASDTGIFIWNSCADRQAWSVRFLPGGRPVSFSGSLASSAGFASMSGVSQESSDRLAPAPFSSANPGPILYQQNVGSRTGFDGFDFRVPSGSILCFAPTSATEWPIRVGQNRIQVGGTPVNLMTLGACVP